MVDTVVIGAGASGLAAAYELARHGADVVVFEKLGAVGGLARTIPHDECRFDLGPHRFFTKNEEIHQLFVDVVGRDLLHVPRLTRILYRSKLFDYPLKPLNAFLGIGPARSVAVLGSYLLAKLRAMVSPEPRNFEEWVTQQFGAQLFRMFFKTYTEKVWRIPCTEIGAEWAAQRIKGMSLGAAVQAALLPSTTRNIKTLVDEFVYPRLGAGQLYEKMLADISARSGRVLTGRQVTCVHREATRVRSIVVQDEAGVEEEVEAVHFLSSAPLTDTIEMMVPPAPDRVLAACRALRYLNHIAVNLKVRGPVFPDNWIYIHSEDVRAARIANYRNFSEAMAGGDEFSPLTVEYFALPEEPTWHRSPDELVSMAREDLARMKIVAPADIASAFVVRSEKAYPVIEIGYEQPVLTIKSWLDEFDNIVPIGRCGLFRYNNQDHAIATGLAAARRSLGLGQADPWAINIDAEYLESGEAR